MWLIIYRYINIYLKIDGALN